MVSYSKDWRRQIKLEQKKAKIRRSVVEHYKIDRLPLLVGIFSRGHVDGQEHNNNLKILLLQDDLLKSAKIIVQNFRISVFPLIRRISGRL